MSTIIIDIGTYSIKYGFTDSTHKGGEIPSTVSCLKRSTIHFCIKNLPPLECGKKIDQNQSLYSISYPFLDLSAKNIQHLMNCLLQKIETVCKDLRSENHFLVLFPAHLNKTLKIDICNLFYKKYPNSYLTFPNPSRVLFSLLQWKSLTFQNTFTGISFEFGECMTRVVPIIQNRIVHKNIRICRIGARDLNYELATVLKRSGCSVETTADIETIREIKEKSCFIALDLQKERSNYKKLDSNFKPTKGEMSNGLLKAGSNIIKNTSHRFECCEIFFQGTKSFQSLIVSSILGCDPKYHQKLFNNIILSGGSCNIPGFSKRLKYEITKLMKGKFKTKLHHKFYSRPNLRIQMQFLNYFASHLFLQQKSHKQNWYHKKKFIQNQNTLLDSDFNPKLTQNWKVPFYLTNTRIHDPLRSSIFQQKIPFKTKKVVPGCVFDLGSHEIKIGLAGDEIPKFTEKTIVGTYKYSNIHPGEAPKPKYLNDTKDFQSIMYMEHLIKNGLIQNWEHFQQIFNSLCYSYLRAHPHVCYFHISEPTLVSHKYRSKYSEILFEDFEVAGLYFSPQGLISEYLTGSPTYLSVSISKGLTQICPVYSNCIIPQGVKQLNFGGEQITQYLKTGLIENGYDYSNSNELYKIQHIKETLCYVPNKNYKMNVSNVLDWESKKINIDQKYRRCGDILFQPQMYGFQFKPIHELINDSISKCPLEIQKTLWQNIYCYGGTTYFNGFITRLNDELSKSTSNEIKIKHDTKIRYPVFLTGSIQTELVNFQNVYVLKNEYEEYGSNIFLRNSPFIDNLFNQYGNNLIQKSNTNFKKFQKFNLNKSQNHSKNCVQLNTQINSLQLKSNQLLQKYTQTVTEEKKLRDNNYALKQKLLELQKNL
ncbi:actin-5c-related [Anaeramoeba flamelloides]|uniref:Actin-5c-related n=1 Tax=Anaeramoeba flamelloides TaxID=1746091 RepID=A0ABQ8X641_9EUKA|nr:actin-5c-related [Anaeramoeba flamelloides]